MGKKIFVPCLDVIMIAFFPRNLQWKIIFLIGYFRVASSLCFKSEAKCEAIDTKMIFNYDANKTHFHNKGFALSLALKVRFFPRKRRLLLHPNTVQGSFFLLQSYSKKTFRKNVPKSARKCKRNVLMPPGHPIILLKSN